jgi:class 3 adenylate cyclase
MPPAPSWLAIASDAAVLRRGALTSIVVGTVLTVANHADELLSGGIPSSQWPAILITYAVPFAVSCFTSTVTILRQRQLGDAGTELLEREIQAINKFPGQNPNPVMRMDEAGTLTYRNDSAEPIVAAWGIGTGEYLPAAVLAELRAAAASDPPGQIEVTHARQTFAVLPIHVPDLGVFNLYGTDITAAKVVERFPDRNPHPVLRMTPGGELWYANEASLPITRALAIEVGDPLPGDLFAALRARLADPSAPLPEVRGEGGRTYRITPVLIPEFDFVNLYGTDITAERAFDKFPNENPNPVLRLNHEGRMTYGNPASVLVRKALGAEVGEVLDPAMFARIQTAVEDPSLPTIEVQADGRIFRILAVSVYEFEAINLYGTDITAARQVEELSAANERLLLSILPPSIAARLRAGETTIADRFDDMTVLFADVVGFTELSSRLAPGDVVRLLNGVFSMCDQLADRYRLEKIKTVGDAYMAVGGLAETARAHSQHDPAVPHPPDDMPVNGGAPATGEAPATGADPDRPVDFVHRSHPADVADMALAMLADLGAYGRAEGLGLEMRVGMHVGPAVARVNGLMKFINDVWGDTVNTASRMESTGIPGRVQVTRETYDRLKDEFEFESRGMIAVKGKGEIETWFLVGRR